MKTRRSAGMAIAAAGLIVILGAASMAQAADKERGRRLYENHCVTCHTPKVHSRPNRIPITLDELRRIVANWAQEENLRWTEADINDVVWYLNTTRYRFTQ